MRALSTLGFFLVVLNSAMARAQDKSLALWPDNPPGRIVAEGEERDTSGPDGRSVAGRSVLRIGHVSTPTLTIYSPASDVNTGTAVLVCPGGGYNILAYDLEGSEVCEWLNSIGVTGILLKYRVPKPAGENTPIGPLMDAQRALSLVRNRAGQLGIKSDRIGVLGFSAGGNLSARLATNYHVRAYEVIDSTDQVSCRPDFAVLVYPAYLFDKNSPELVAANLPIDDQTPPMFLTMAFNDGVGPENILRMGLALKAKGVPAEVHLYPTGGHGYGLRPSEHQASTWPDRCAAWMKANGWLDK